jgi:hypothetical protein
MVDVITQGNLERVRIISQFNQAFKEAYLQSDLEYYCKVTTCPGNEKFKHGMSSFFLRSGFKITIENDSNIEENNFVDIASYVIASAPFVRQLMALGYDTLILKGKTRNYEVQYSLKEVSDFHKYMIDRR